jgi:hypothetical protein
MWYFALCIISYSSSVTVAVCLCHGTFLDGRVVELKRACVGEKHDLQGVDK